MTTITPAQAIATTIKLGITYAGLDEYISRETVVQRLLQEYRGMSITLYEAELALNNVAEPLDIATDGAYNTYDLIVYAVDEILFQNGQLPVAPFADLEM